MRQTKIVLASGYMQLNHSEEASSAPSRIAQFDDRFRHWMARSDDNPVNQLLGTCASEKLSSDERD
jgi:hypothetical protein